jgi:hypothetical protein
MLAFASAACGDDDDGTSETPSVTADASATSTPAASTLPAQSFQPGIITASPGRELPEADHIGLNVIDPLTFYEQRLHGGALTPVFCAGIDLTTGIIDCIDAGYGTIAVDPIPEVASGELQCRALLDTESVFFAASCSGMLQSGPGAYIYAIQS